MQTCTFVRNTPRRFNVDNLPADTSLQTDVLRAIRCCLQWSTYYQTIQQKI